MALGVAGFYVMGVGAVGAFIWHPFGGCVVCLLGYTLFRLCVFLDRVAA